MPKQSLNKSIAAKKLHHRTLTPLAEPEVTIPFGAIIDKIQIDRDSAVFEYLTEKYGCSRDLLESALPGDIAPAERSSKTGGSPHTDEPPAKLRFETLSSDVDLSRAKVPGGWLLATRQGGIAFYPDNEHSWNGESL